MVNGNFETVLKKIISSHHEDDAVDETAGNDYQESYGETSVSPPVPAPMSYGSSAYSSETSYSSAPSQMSKNMLASDVEIKGSLKFSDELILDGAVEGEVHSDSGHLTVGENAKIKGEVKVRAVVVYGKVDGNLLVTERCELKADAEIVGDIRAGTLSIEEGAAFMGQSSVGAAAVAAATSKPASSPSSSSSKS